MRSSRNRRRLLLATLPGLLAGPPAFAQEAAPAGDATRQTRPDRRVGVLHDRLRAQRAKELADRPAAASPYADYLDFKALLARYGVTAQLSPSLFTQWGAPAGGKPAV